MALKITRASDPIEVKTTVTTLYAQPGLGRTTVAYSSEAPLLLDFDQGAHRAKNRKDTVQITSWADVEKMDAADFAPYKTAIVDTVGRALDAMTVKIIGLDARNGNRAGGLSLQGYGVLKTTFVAWLNTLRSYGLDVVLLAHMDEQRSGDDVKERLDIQGGSKNEVYKVSDAMGRIYMENRKRVLNFSPSDVAFGKNPAQLEPIDVPHYDKMGPFLADIISRTKAEINKQTAEQMEVAALVEAWKLKVDAAKTPADFDALILLGKELDERIRTNAKAVLVKGAKDHEFTFDAKTGVFVGKEPAPKDPGNGSTTSPGPNTTPPAQPASGPEAGATPKTAPPDDPDATTNEILNPNIGGKKRGKKKTEEKQPELPTGDREPGSDG